MEKNILNKIKKAWLLWRWWAAFPTHLKWKFVKASKWITKYVICNASEWEIWIFKDIYILENHIEQVFHWMSVVMDFLETKYAFININDIYFDKIKISLNKKISKYNKKWYIIKIFKEKPSYIWGEETTILNSIEWKRIQPRLKPPYPASKWLFGKPTLIHNVETLFDISDVANWVYEKNRFYCITANDKRIWVYHLPSDLSIYDILNKTNNFPDFDFFVQIWWSASGIVLNMKQLKANKMSGAWSIEIYKSSIKSRDIILKWLKFFNEESCGKCTPCREGTYQLYKEVKNNEKINWHKIFNILDLLDSTAFCALWKSVSVPIRSYYKNVLPLFKKINLRLLLWKK